MGNDTRGSGHDYIDRGWAVMLLAKDDSEGKIPPKSCPSCDWRRPGAVKHDPEACDHLLCHSFYAATKDHHVWDQMMDTLPHGKLAIRTGRASKLLVVDAESHAPEGEPTGLDTVNDWNLWFDGESLPDTLTARSVSGGEHYFFRLVDDVYLKSGRILPGVDVKIENGYVGAVSGDGRREWLGGQLVDAPRSLVTWLQTTRRQGGVGSGGGSRAAGYDYAEFIKNGCPDGHRDDFMNDVIFRLRKRGLSYGKLCDEVWKVYTEIAQPPQARYEMPWVDVEYKINRAMIDVQPDTNLSAAAQLTQRWQSAQQSSDKPRKIGRVTVVPRGRR